MNEYDFFYHWVEKKSFCRQKLFLPGRFFHRKKTVFSTQWQQLANPGHSATCHPALVTFPHLSQPKLVLNLAILVGCKAELTWVVVISQDSLTDTH